MGKDRGFDFVTPTQEAAEAALSLAPKHEYEHFLRCDRADGTIEIVVLEKGSLNHYLVDGSGMTELLETLDAPARHVWGRRIRNVGLVGTALVFVAGFVAGFVFQPKNGAWFGIPFAVAWAVTVIGALIHRDHDLHAYVRSRTGSEEGWSRLPYRLGGWPARTTAQLEAVRKLSDDGEGEARVCEQLDGRAEVVTMRGRYRYRHLVDLAGVIVEEAVEPVSRRRRLKMRLINARGRGGDERCYTIRTAVPSH